MSALLEQLGLGAGEKRLTRPAWLALFAIALLALLPGYFSIPTMDRDEARYSQASRQMQETGDYIDIRFQEQPRHVKPAGIYWMQTVTAAPFGGPDAPQWAYRLPSLIGVLIAVGVTAWFGARLGGARVGFAAGAMIALCLLIAIEARTAKTDAMLLAAAVFAQAALYYLFHPPDGQEGKGKFVGAPLIFWAGTGAALIIKGPIVTMVSATTILGLCLWRRDASVLKRLHLLKGLLVAAVIGLPWLVAITIQTNGGFIEESIGHALLGKVAQSDDSHGGPIGYHTVALLLTFWPSFLLIGLAGLYAWKKRAEPAVQYLIAWILPTWIIFELVVTKLPHYTLPVFPAIAILTAMALEDAAALLSEKKSLWFHRAILLLFLIITLALGALPWLLADEISTAVPAIAPFIVVLVLMVAAAGIYLHLKPGLERLLPLLAAGILFYFGAFALMMPWIDKFWMSRSLEREVAKLEGCDEIKMATLGYREPSAVFIFGTETVLGEQPSVVKHLTDYPACGLVAVEGRDQAAFLAEASSLSIGLKPLGEAEGYNYVKGDELLITLYASSGSSLSVRAD